MKKAGYLALVIVAIIITLTSWLLLMQPQPKQTTVSYDFETGLGEWLVDSHAPQDPNMPGQSVAWKIELAMNVSLSGSRSVLFYVDGKQDDGTIWIERKIMLQPNSVTMVNVSFQLWSGSESFNTIAVAVGYAGKENPEAEADFQVLDATNQAAGWKTYSFSSEVQTGSMSEVYFALGISVRWETEMTYFIDDVTLNLG